MLTIFGCFSFLLANITVTLTVLKICDLIATSWLLIFAPISLSFVVLVFFLIPAMMEEYKRLKEEEIMELEHRRAYYRGETDIW